VAEVVRGADLVEVEADEGGQEEVLALLVAGVVVPAEDSVLLAVADSQVVVFRPVAEAHLRQVVVLPEEVARHEHPHLRSNQAATLTP